MHLMEAGSYRIAINAFDRDDSGVCAGPYAPHVQVGNACIPRPFDEFADFLFEMTFMRVEQNARRVTHQRPRPDCDDSRTNQAHDWVEPDPAEVLPSKQGNNRQNRSQRVGQNMDVSRPEIVVMVMVVVRVSWW